MIDEQHALSLIPSQIFTKRIGRRWKKKKLLKLNKNTSDAHCRREMATTFFEDGKWMGSSNEYISKVQNAKCLKKLIQERHKEMQAVGFGTVPESTGTGRGE